MTECSLQNLAVALPPITAATQNENKSHHIFEITPHNIPSLCGPRTGTTYNMEVKKTNYKKILFFDVETTGLLPKFIPRTTSMPVLNYYPHILQLSFIVYDTIKQTVVQEYNEYIHVSKNIFISPKIEEITGITWDLIEKKGISILNALLAFYKAYIECDCIVAHNLSFDQKMIEIELHRNIQQLNNIQMICMFNSLFNKIHNIDLYCTMKAGKTICDIKVLRKTNDNDNTQVSEISIDDTVDRDLQTKSYYIKYPKLSELVEKLFGQVPTNLHDAYYDTKYCMQCFCKMNNIPLTLK